MATTKVDLGLGGGAMGWRPRPTPGLTLGAQLALIAVGPVPVTLIGLSTFGIVGLLTLAVAVLLPALGLLAAVLISNRTARSLTLGAVGIGLVATLVYDLFRWSFLVVGWMDRDPIPHIGTSLGLAPGWLFGYLWRFVGNGGGLALTFVAAGGRGAVAGTLYGLAVCSGLLAVLAFAPLGQEALFPLDGTTLVVAVVGHIIYGSVLGALVERTLPPPNPGGAWIRVRATDSVALVPDWNQKVVKSRGGDFAPGERLVGACLYQAHGTGDNVTTAALFGAIGVAIARSRAGRRAERLQAELPPTALARRLPPRGGVVAATDQRLMIFGAKTGGFSVKVAEPAAWYRWEELAGWSYKPKRRVSDLNLWFADGSQAVVELPKSGKPDGFANALNIPPAP